MPGTAMPTRQSIILPVADTPKATLPDHYTYAGHLRDGSMRRVNTLLPGVHKQKEGVPYHLAVVAEEVTDAVRWVLLVRHTSLRVGVRAWA